MLGHTTRRYVKLSYTVVVVRVQQAETNRNSRYETQGNTRKHKDNCCLVLFRGSRYDTIRKGCKLDKCLASCKPHQFMSPRNESERRRRFLKSPKRKDNDVTRFPHDNMPMVKTCKVLIACCNGSVRLVTIPLPMISMRSPHACSSANVSADDDVIDMRPYALIHATLCRDACEHSSEHVRMRASMNRWTNVHVSLDAWMGCINSWMHGRMDRGECMPAHVCKRFDRLAVDSTGPAGLN